MELLGFSMHFQEEGFLPFKLWGATEAGIEANIRTRQFNGIYFRPVYSHDRQDLTAVEHVLPESVALAREFAMKHHGDQRYGKNPDSPLYVYHLDHVLAEYISVGGNDLRIMVSIYFHDLIEDTEASYDDIKEFCTKIYVYSQDIVSNVYAVTDVPDPNRPNKGIYNADALKVIDTAWQVKLCDRLANCRQNLRDHNAIRAKYRSQQKTWEESLYRVMPMYPRRFDLITFELQSRLNKLVNV
jgi:(p)ppGpp synthase/HD superfamily hydrolase